MAQKAVFKRWSAHIKQTQKLNFVIKLTESESWDRFISEVSKIIVAGVRNDEVLFTLQLKTSSKVFCHSVSFFWMWAIETVRRSWVYFHRCQNHFHRRLFIFPLVFHCSDGWRSLWNCSNLMLMVSFRSCECVDRWSMCLCRTLAGWNPDRISAGQLNCSFC